MGGRRDPRRVYQSSFSLCSRSYLLNVVGVLECEIAGDGRRVAQILRFLTNTYYVRTYS